MPDVVAAPERALPHNLEAERSVLGAILIHNEAFNYAAQIVRPEDFFRLGHRRIFDKMIALGEKGGAIDTVTLKEALSQAGELDDVGGPAYIAGLVDGVPRSTNVEYYARIVKEKSTLRSLIHASQSIAARAWDAEDDPNTILDEAEQTIFAIAEDRAKQGFVSMRQIVDESLPKIEQLFEQKKLITGVPTGFVDLDGMTRGMQRGRPDHRRRPPVDGQDQPGAEHRRARGARARAGRGLLQPGNVEGVALHPPADLGRADRRAQAADRAHRAARLRAAVAGDQPAQRGAHLHRRQRRGWACSRCAPSRGAWRPSTASA